ncbi:MULTISPECIES: hypothetical protein [Clostridium]|uniref:Uncharacterized protein n=1 Tax=Clostridium beijerinckii TaxID=1520 RepID=A0A1S9N891_CLOBE|nr:MULTISPECIES: hypothetical protein [Clostridium]MBN7577267.1 hypothetical protein [Clostridium beijerinckii]MBN7579816.1 hypothetical protein [Clostridium beijerinckii]MBN7587038.1 hypothetical protein [Clostridium beijerinckii]MZK50992.1 hypothetical protein [Clostridium beijerinckii]MZK59194.1 hypothetical protein [Clostridium beijerinckii]
MDKRKYETKTLIAEYRDLSKLKECRFSENAYELKDGSKIIEYEGAPLSLYGLKLSYNKNIGRKGIFSVTSDDYEFWKSFRARIDDNSFVDYEAERNEDIEKAREEYNKQVNAEH